MDSWKRRSSIPESSTMSPANMTKLWALISNRHLLVWKEIGRRLSSLFSTGPVNRILACLFSIGIMTPWIGLTYIQPWTTPIEGTIVPKIRKSNSLRKDTTKSLTQLLSTTKFPLIKDRSCKILTLRLFFRTQLQTQALLVAILEEICKAQSTSKTVS